jgi:hypothetical protein
MFENVVVCERKAHSEKRKTTWNVTFVHFEFRDGTFVGFLSKAEPP